MGKRNRVRRQSIRELPIILGPLPLPDARLFDDRGSGVVNGSSSAAVGSNDSLSIVSDRSEEGVEDRLLEPAEGEPLPR